MDIDGILITGNGISSSQNSGVTISIGTAVFKELQTLNTNGGTFTSGSRQVRTLNTAVSNNNIVGMSLSGTTGIICPAGRYLVSFECPGYGVNSHQAYLTNATNATDLVTGSSSFAANMAGVTGAVGETMNFSIGYGLISIPSVKVLQLQHICSQTVSSIGLGKPGNFAGSSGEVYSQITFMKVG